MSASAQPYLRCARLWSCPPTRLATLYLQCVAPSHIMARFYGMSVRPTLFGSVSLVRNWGRIGRLGRFKIEPFDDLPGLERALGRIASRKRRRGYAEPSIRQA
ncbi:WGR domain-containing protein [Labrys sp. KNU-23]|uniref:WGR domain-containing protein n=1 Tax=Labrys sp. KNU-23 TaxID=2789216 RepID=UPI0011EC8E12|nr:WGR domain-containing protein [Labrys sp. KNU-23]QEN85488.1 WGR domain-containing protein [Labrys sp. KNU-23]